jgi:hypothetical protein
VGREFSKVEVKSEVERWTDCFQSAEGGFKVDSSPLEAYKTKLVFRYLAARGEEIHFGIRE